MKNKINKVMMEKIKMKKYNKNISLLHGPSIKLPFYYRDLMMTHKKRASVATATESAWWTTPTLGRKASKKQIVNTTSSGLVPQKCALMTWKSA